MEFKPLRNKDLRKYSIVPIRAIKLLADKKIPQTAFNVLVVMCCYTDQIGRTWVSQQRLADELNVTRETINRNLKKLRDTGLLTRVKKQFKDQPTRTYRVIYQEDIISVEDARGTLNARELLELTEKEDEFKKVCDAQRITEDKGGVTPRDHKECDAIGSHKRLINDYIYNNNSVTVERSLVIKYLERFKNLGQSLGQMRNYNLRDIEVMSNWVREGLEMKDWLNILDDHLKYCRSTRRPIAYALGYFKQPVQKALNKSQSYKINQTIKDLSNKFKS